MCCQGQTWSIWVELRPYRKIQYKYILISTEGEVKSWVQWEKGPNSADREFYWDGVSTTQDDGVVSSFLEKKATSEEVLLPRISGHCDSSRKWKFCERVLRVGLDDWRCAQTQVGLWHVWEDAVCHPVSRAEAGVANYPSAGGTEVRQSFLSDLDQPGGQNWRCGGQDEGRREDKSVGSLSGRKWTGSRLWQNLAADWAASRRLQPVPEATVLGDWHGLLAAKDEEHRRQTREDGECHGFSQGGPGFTLEVFGETAASHQRPWGRFCSPEGDATNTAAGERSEKPSGFS